VGCKDETTKKRIGLPTGKLPIDFRLEPEFQGASKEAQVSFPGWVGLALIRFVFVCACRPVPEKPGANQTALQPIRQKRAALERGRVDQRQVCCRAQGFARAGGGVLFRAQIFRSAIAFAQVEAAFELVKSLKDEPPVGMPDARKITHPADFDYDPQAQLDTLGGV